MKSGLFVIIALGAHTATSTTSYTPSGALPHRIKLDIGGVPQDLGMQLSVSPWKVDIPPLEVAPLALNQNSIIDCTLCASHLIGLYLVSQSLLSLANQGRLLTSTLSMSIGMALSYFSLKELLKRNNLELHCFWSGITVNTPQ